MAAVSLFYPWLFQDRLEQLLQGPTELVLTYQKNTGAVCAWLTKGPTSLNTTHLKLVSEIQQFCTKRCSAPDSASGSQEPDFIEDLLVSE